MVLEDRNKNNFDFLRVVAAICIAATHSFDLLGKHKEEYLVDLSGDKFEFSQIGLSIFFTISGFLIIKSAATSASITNFVWKRLLRIQPMLVLVCSLSILIVGPIFTTLSTNAYFSSPDTWAYFRNVMPIFGIQFSLPGVFTNLSDTGVNGSLWTLIVEERLYVIVGFLLVFQSRNKVVYIVTVGLLNLIFLLHFVVFNETLLLYFNQHHIQYAMMFLNAGLMFHLRLPFRTHPFKFFVSALIAILVLAMLHPLIYFWIWVVPICILGFAHLKLILNNAGKYGDFTYGIYIFAFPVQQIIISEYGLLITPAQLFLSSMFVCIPLAILSWHLLEKKCLLLKNRVGV